MFKNRKLIGAALAAVCACVACVVYAAAADVIKERQQGLKHMGEEFKAVMDGMRGGNLDPNKVKELSATVNKTANAMANWFPQGSGPEAGVKTAAKPEIWSDRATFDAARQKLVDEGQKFAQVANSGDMSGVGMAARGLGGACKGCHDKFRVKED